MTQKQTIGNVPRSMAMIRSVALALAVTMPLTAPLPGVNASEKELPTKLVDTFEQGRGVVTLALNPDGTLMASGNSDTTIQLWDLARQRVIATLPGHAKTVDHVAFSADGKTLFSASKEDGVVKLWDVAARKNLATLNYPKRYIHALASSKDGKLLAVATGDTIQLVDIATSKSAGSLGKKGDGTGSGPMAFSSDGKTLVAGPRLRGGALADSGKVKVWDVEGGKLKSTFRVERFDEFRDSWWVSPDGKSAVAIKLSGLDRIIRMETWDTATGELKQTTDFGKGNKREYTRAVLVDGGKTLVGFSDKATFWDAEKQEITAELASLGGRGIRVAVSGDGKSVAGWGNNVLVLDVSGPKRKAEMVGGMHGHPRGLFFSSDGKVLTSSYEEFSYFWEVGTGKYLFNIPLTLSGVNSAADNKTFFCSVGGSRWQSRFFVHESGTPLHIDDFFVGKDLVLDKTETQFGVIRCMASTRDGKTLAAGFDGHNTIRIWNVAGLKIEKRKVEGEVFTGVKTVQILKGHADEVRMVTFSEDGKSPGIDERSGRIQAVGRRSRQGTEHSPSCRSEREG